MTNNQATAGDGGAMAVSTASGAIAISSSSFTGNSAPSGYGGAMYLGSSQATLTTVTVTENQSGISGGGVYYGFIPSSDAQVCVSNCVFDLNQSKLGVGANIASAPAQFRYLSSALAIPESVESLDPITVAVGLNDAFGQRAISIVPVPLRISAVRHSSNVSALFSTTPAADALVLVNGSATFEFQFAAPIGAAVNVRWLRVYDDCKSLIAAPVFAQRTV